MRYLMILAAALLGCRTYCSEKDTGYADGDADGYAAADGDCADTDPAVHPGAAEICDGIDQNCDGTADEYAVDAVRWYIDADGDGFGGATQSILACACPEGFAGNFCDPDDGAALVVPDSDDPCLKADTSEPQ